MAARYHCPTDINGINLADYVPKKRTYNSIVFIHKRIAKPHEEQCIQSETNSRENDNIPEQRGKDKRDKWEGLNGTDHKPTAPRENPKEKRKTKPPLNNDSVLEHTIKFAKNIAPLAIPPTVDGSVHYTININKRKKKNDTKKRNSNSEKLVKGKSTRIIETFRQENSFRDSFGTRNSISTLEEIHMNQTLSFSEISEKKYSRRHRNSRASSKENLQHDSLKWGASDSFEAFATELSKSVGRSKIKINLMNEKDKALLTDNIRAPVIKAIAECVQELKSYKDHNTELQTVQRIIKCNSDKLDTVLDKLTCIENKITKAMPDTNTLRDVTPSDLKIYPVYSDIKDDKDLLEVKDMSFSEDDSPQRKVSEKKKVKNRRAVVTVKSNQSKEGRIFDYTRRDGYPFGCGELPALLEKSSSSKGDCELSSKMLDASRYCWTDKN